MRSRAWVILIVIAAVLAVFLAKRATKSPSPPEPAALAQAPQTQTPVAPAGPPPSAAGVPAEGERPPTSPEPAPPNPTQAEPQPAPEQPAGPQPPAPQEQPAEQAPETSPEPVEPLPGSKLAESLQNGRPTMADFGAGWCKACKQMEPVLEKAAAKYAGTANIVYVDTDDYGTIARQYRIRLIPTQIFFDSNGKEAFRNTGPFPIEKIDEQFAKLGANQ